MTVPTQPVTVRLSDFGGPSIAGVRVSARLDRMEVTGTGQFVSTEAVSGDTDENGEVILELFPNAPVPTGLGTMGSRVRVTAQVPGSRPLDVQCRVPDLPSVLAFIVISDEEVPALDAAEMAVLQAQTAASSAAENAAIAVQAAADAAAATDGVAEAVADDAQAAVDAAAAAAASLAAAQLIASGALVSRQEFTGTGPYTVTAPGATAIVGILVNGARARISKFNVVGLTITNVSYPFISAAAEVDVEYV